MLDLFAELSSIAAIFQKNEIDYALVGGLAYSVWVEARATEDIDLLIYPQDWERASVALEPEGYIQLADPMDFKSIRIRRLTKFINNDTLILDFLLADGELAEAVKNAQNLNYLGHNYKVAVPPALIQLKEGRMSSRDKLDIEGLRRLMGEDS